MTDETWQKRRREWVRGEDGWIRYDIIAVGKASEEGTQSYHIVAERLREADADRIIEDHRLVARYAEALVAAYDFFVSGSLGDEGPFTWYCDFCDAPGGLTKMEAEHQDNCVAKPIREALSQAANPRWSEETVEWDEAQYQNKKAQAANPEVK